MTSAKDPVCGMDVDPLHPKGGSATHEGRIYFFCSAYCREKFSQSPQQVLHPKPTAPSKSDGRLYTCPMHPEVRQQGPGSCPLCGMALEPMTISLDDEVDPELSDMSGRFMLSLLFTVPLLILSMLPMISSFTLLPENEERWIEWALATPVIAWAAAPLFQRFWLSLRHRSLNMFTLIGLGTGAAYLYSIAASLAPSYFPTGHHRMGSLPGVYFESAAAIVTLVLLGQVLELRARGKTSSALRQLLHLVPPVTHRLSADGAESDVPLESIQVGDRLRIKPGERVPVDGIVLEGASAVDESLLSGESVPIGKVVGSEVVSGTINGLGSLVIEAARVGKDTVLSHIVRLVSEAQRSRAPIQRIADRVSRVFVPAVVVVAVLSGISWFIWGPPPQLANALVNSVAVLIIACPCALGLATPMSIMVGVGRGAREGVLVRSAEALETLAQVDVLLLDKTGTLTEGKPRLANVLVLPDFSELDVLGIAAGLERASEHPLAAAVIEGAKERGIKIVPPVADFRALPGQGVEGLFQGRRARLGSAAWLESFGADMRMLRDRAERLRQSGESVTFLAIDEKPAAILGIQDPIRPQAYDVLNALQDEGLELLMVTGDHRTTALAVAERVGIDPSAVHSEIKPEDKIALVKTLQQQGHRIAMVGDGVNDAPALSQADVGIAMGTGTDIAQQSAGITLMGGQLAGLVRARVLSRDVLRNIRQNLFFAFVYNLVGVPLAAGLFYPFFGWLLSPIVASAAMSLSSVSVISNALRLRKPSR